MWTERDCVGAANPSCWWAVRRQSDKIMVAWLNCFPQGDGANHLFSFSLELYSINCFEKKNHSMLGSKKKNADFPLMGCLTAWTLEDICLKSTLSTCLILQCLLRRNRYLMESESEIHKKMIYNVSPPFCSLPHPDPVSALPAPNFSTKV